mmetsp:Transcript_55280/g.155556  ORF Transcript_55280/g.155556 Transcript_55280/m.155556 type:complete len:222 (+) Transcript_55280:917-1582(+)
MWPMSWLMALTNSAHSSSGDIKLQGLLCTCSHVNSTCDTSTACAQLWYLGVFRYLPATVSTKAAMVSSPPTSTRPRLYLSRWAHTSRFCAPSSCRELKLHSPTVCTPVAPSRLIGWNTMSTWLRSLILVVDSVPLDVDMESEYSRISPRYWSVCSSLGFARLIVISLSAASLRTTLSSRSVSAAHSSTQFSSPLASEDFDPISDGLVGAQFSFFCMYWTFR